MLGVPQSVIWNVGADDMVGGGSLLGMRKYGAVRIGIEGGICERYIYPEVS